MAALTSSLSLIPKIQYSTDTGNKDYEYRGTSVVEEIKGLIRVHKDGHVERPQIVPCVTADNLDPQLNVTCRDVVIDSVTNIWARLYVPNDHKKNLPLLVYFHGGGFCIGSAAWSCYHDFLARLSTKVGCLIISVNYRLAPENPLPAPYDDGIKTLKWVTQQFVYQYEDSEWWTKKCNFSSNVFLGGDSAGANIAYNVATSWMATCDDDDDVAFLNLKGLILIQPFFGGEVRTSSEKYCMMAESQGQGSALNLEASDTYWRLALPFGVDRDHPWCNPYPLVKLGEILNLKILVCISEMDILKDRNLELCDALGKAAAAAGNKKRVEYEVFKGVGHAFQILSTKSHLSKTRTLQMMARLNSFITMDL